MLTRIQNRIPNTKYNFFAGVCWPGKGEQHGHRWKNWPSDEHKVKRRPSDQSYSNRSLKNNQLTPNSSHRTHIIHKTYCTMHIPPTAQSTTIASFPFATKVLQLKPKNLSGVPKPPIAVVESLFSVHRSAHGAHEPLFQCTLPTWCCAGRATTRCLDRSSPPPCWGTTTSRSSTWLRSAEEPCSRSTFLGAATVLCPACCQCLISRCPLISELVLCILAVRKL